MVPILRMLFCLQLSYNSTTTEIIDLPAEFSARTVEILAREGDWNDKEEAVHGCEDTCPSLGKSSS